MLVDVFPLLDLSCPCGCVHAEYVGGVIATVVTLSCIIGAFPWKFEGGEACPCRILAFFDVGSMVVKD